jgi:hypothetical protein
MTAIKKWAAALFASLTGLFLSMGTAHAALDSAIETAISDAGADLKTAGLLVVVALAGFWAIRKVGQKLGMW